MSDDLHREALNSDTYHRVRGIELAAIALAALPSPLGSGPAGARAALSEHGLEAGEAALDMTSDVGTRAAEEADRTFDQRLARAVKTVTRAQELLRLDLDDPLDVVFLVVVLSGPGRNVLEG